jgi:hypothetical protein
MIEGQKNWDTLVGYAIIAASFDVYGMSYTGYTVRIVQYHIYNPSIAPTILLCYVLL